MLILKNKEKNQIQLEEAIKNKTKNNRVSMIITFCN